MYFKSSKHHSDTSLCHEQFTVRHDLLGLAIGSSGANIHRAKQVHGIHSVEVDGDQGIIYIAGEVMCRRITNDLRDTQIYINIYHIYIYLLVYDNGHVTYQSVNWFLILF